MPGVIATAFTPFNDDENRSLNLSVIPQIAEYFRKSSFGCVLINGTYGEGMAMTVDERMKVADAWSEAVGQATVGRNKQQLMIQVGGTNLQDVKRLAEHAQSIKAEALLCLPELYYKPKTVAELIDYLKEVGEAAPDTPLFYYHSPLATGVALAMDEVFFTLCKDRIPSFAGVKFAIAHLDDLLRAVRSAGDRFKVIVASNHNLPAYVQMGIDTFMPTAVSVRPTTVMKIYEAAASGRYREAQELQKPWSDFVDSIAALNNGNAAPPMKAMAARSSNIILGPPRKPLKSFETPEGLAQITDLLMKMDSQFQLHQVSYC
ncbi:N-acetylneuraminate lyase-like isoform X2 [Copidosoma floridanum]|uniref:N-acetylneuraminate lyase-like isoform X2 n=1 Tax=Copidosoma floridanum TaxID=29053 RepID=UPI0006C9B403|nr:N-acetylneuraminate lyase-like isoform X2 [Copidosoma floridanum]